MKANKKQVKIIVVVLFLIVVVLGGIYFFTRSDNEKPEASLIEMTLPGNTQNVMSNIEGVTIEKSMFKDVLHLNGWVFKQDTKDKIREVYLVLKSKQNTLVFDLEKDNLPRPDVTKHFQMIGGVDNHGFEGYIPMKLLVDTSYRAGFVIKDATGQYYSTSSKEIKISDGKVTLNNCQTGSNQVSITFKPVTAKVKYYFEKLDLTDNSLTISGWSFFEGMNTDSLNTYIVLKNDKASKVFSVIVQPRKDVTSFFKSSGLNIDLCGFTTKIIGDELEKGHYEVCIYNVKANHVGLTYTGKFIDIGK